MTTPYQNRFQTFGVGQQADAGTAVVPTAWLLVTDNGNVTADPVKVAPEYATGTRFQLPGVLQAITWENKNVSGKATPAWVKLMLIHMFGAAVAGVITPSGNTVDAELFPVKPLTIEGVHPAGNLKVTDVVCQELTLTLVERNVFNISHVFTGLLPEVLVAPTAAVLPVAADQWQYSEFTSKVNAVAAKVQAFNITIKSGIVMLKAAGSLTGVGYSADEEIEVSGSVQYLVDVADLKTAYPSSQATVPLEFQWTKGANKNLKIDGTAEITSRSVSSQGMGKVLVTYGFKYVSVAGAAPCAFTWS